MTRGWSRLSEARRIAADKAERDLLTATLAETAGNLSEAARRLDTDTSNLRRAMRQYGLRREQYQGEST